MCRCLSHILWLNCFICLINGVFISMWVQNHKRLSFDFNRWRFFRLKSFNILCCTKNHSVSISSNKYRAKNQLSRLFETHSPWLICYHSFVSARCFVVEVELKSESKYKPLISIGNVNESNKETHQMEQVPNRKGHSKIGEWTLQKCWVFAEIVVFLLRLWRKNKKL